MCFTVYVSYKGTVPPYTPWQYSIGIDAGPSSRGLQYVGALPKKKKKKKKPLRHEGKKAYREAALGPKRKKGDGRI